MKKKQDKKRIPVKAFPHDGGCWFCNRKDGTMQFSCEFDTYVHERCIKKALIADAKHSEAKIMAREFEIKIP